jgi:hypothetical protein
MIVQLKELQWDLPRVKRVGYDILYLGWDLTRDLPNTKQGRYPVEAEEGAVQEGRNKM